MRILAFHFEQRKDLTLTLKRIEIEFTFRSRKERLAFVWKVLTRRTVQESTVIAGGPAVAVNITRDGKTWK